MYKEMYKNKVKHKDKGIKMRKKIVQLILRV